MVSNNKKIWASESLGLPLNWMGMATVVYGARGSGKTTLGRVFAEEVSRAGQRFCAIDLKGDWWGLKSSADGKRDGLPVVVFGGDHKDVPLEEGAGKFVAEAVAELKQSCILDLEYFSKGKQVKFLHEFFSALYDANRDPLLLLLDESQRYAPQQRLLDPESMKCLGAVEDLVKLGRKHGIGPVLFTQRGSGLNKEVSELCDLLVAFRTPGPLDQVRVKDWLDANTTKIQRDTVMGKLSGLPTGTAVFASGHPDLKLFGIFPVRRAETFDSSATPKVGEARAEPKKLAAPDLTKLRIKMSEAIERAKADDPAELRRQIAELTKKAKASAHYEEVGAKAKANAAKPGVAKVFEVPVFVEMPIFDEQEFSGVCKEAEEVLHAAKRLSTALNAYLNTARIRGKRASVAARVREKQAVRQAKKLSTKFVPGQPLTASIAEVDEHQKAVRAAPGRALTNGAPDGLSKCARGLLTALAQHGEPLPLAQLAVIASYSPSAGSVFNAAGELRSRGCVTGENKSLTITEEGLQILGDFEELPVGSELGAHWIKRLGKCEGAILDQVLKAYPEPISLTDAATNAGYSPTAGSVFNAAGKLRSLVLALGKNSALVANERLVG